MVRVFGNLFAARVALALVVATAIGTVTWLVAKDEVVAARSPHVAVQKPRALPITDPTKLRRLAFEDLQYAGSFRLPLTPANGETFASGGGPLAFYPGRNSLYVGTRSGRVAEISVPAPKSGTLDELPVAEYLQPFHDPAEGRLKTVASDAFLAGLLIYGERLYGAGLSYYDANNAQRISHFSRPLAMAERGAGPIRSVGVKERTGYVAGYMALVPPEWQSKLGGPAITGQCCVPIVGRTSLGPAAFAWDPADLDRKPEVDAAALLYYTEEHPTLGPWGGSNPSYGSTAEVNGVALVAGTRTALFIGRNGTGPHCYGNGTGTQGLHGKMGTDGAPWCYDPTSTDKGAHAYPYRYQMWAYDLDDWADVRAGRRQPWEIKPYGIWPFDLPFESASTRVYGVAYDPKGQRLFIAQRGADRVGYDYRALIHVFQIP